MALAQRSLKRSTEMVGLRAKLLLGFGGMLVILVTVSLLGESVLDRYSGAMERTFNEEFQSVAACEDMNSAVDHIDTALQQHFWRNSPIDRAELDRWQTQFEQRLGGQRIAATMSGERDATERMAALWKDYRRFYPTLLDQSIPLAQRSESYAKFGLPKAMEVESAMHGLIEMNLNGMLSAHSRARGTAGHFRSAMHMLTICGAALALLFALLIGRFILQPVRVLTDSVRQIEQGNLNLTVPVRTRDELGTLAAAFNQMTTQLRAYRRIEHERLVRTERTTQLAIDSLPDAVIVLNPAGRIELANETAKNLFGIKPGTDVAALSSGWLVDLYRRISRTEHAHALSSYESTIQVEDAGETRAFLPRTVPIADGQGTAIGATIILVDVTGLRRLDEMKNGLLSMVSHELKTPLTSMRMVLHLITEQKVGALAEKQKELLSAARDDAERLHQIVENLLDMARIESGKALMEQQPISPQQLIARAAKEQQAACDLQTVTLTVDAIPDLGLVQADSTRIGHVLSNLLNNALRHTPAGGHIRLGARAAGEWVEFYVSDDGDGIPRPYLHRIFEKFFRVPGQVGGSGSGLGLAISKDIVEAHGGRIRVESAEGRGTEFAFTLRRADAAIVRGEVSAGSQELYDGIDSDARAGAAGDRGVRPAPASAHSG
ncbi:MAG TPA: ATP-binding protein [Humisphaera sp.]|nr:ATP-binding protein [Humisphaera sp.]